MLLGGKHSRSHLVFTNVLGSKGHNEKTVNPAHHSLRGIDYRNRLDLGHVVEPIDELVDRYSAAETIYYSVRVVLLTENPPVVRMLIFVPI